MTLSILTGIESEKLINEKAQLLANIEKYNYILSSEEHVLEVVVNELEEVKAKFGDARKTEISTEALSVEDEDLIPVEDIVITLTNNGYIKRMNSSEFRTQNRGGSGVKGMAVYQDDEVNIMVHCKTHTDILFFTDSGKVFRKRAHEINASGRTGKGIPVLNLLNLEKDEKVVSLISVDEYENKYLFFATKNGIVKRCPLEEFIRINCNGKKAITFKEGDVLLDVRVTNGDNLIALASKKGMLCLFKEDGVRSMGRSASGVKGMNLRGSELIALSTNAIGDKVFVLSEHGLGKLSNIEDYRLTNRGAGGVITIKVTPKTGDLVNMKIVKGDEDIIVITNNGTVIRTSLEQVRLCGRNSQGVKIINLKENEVVSSFTILPKEDCLEEEKTSNLEENPAELN